MLPIREDHPLKHLFSGLVEHAFHTELGICDPALTDYVSDLLIAFIHMDEMAIARDAAGKPIGEIGEMISQHEFGGDGTVHARNRFVHRRIGDYALFWTGVYPESMRRSCGASWRDWMADYISFGKRSYAIASELTPPDEKPPPRLLRRLSEDFESCVCGLGIVRHDLGSQGHGKMGDNSELIY